VGKSNKWKKATKSLKIVAISAPNIGAAEENDEFGKVCRWGGRAALRGSNVRTGKKIGATTVEKKGLSDRDK